MDMLSKLFDLFEPVGENETNAYNVTITEDMSPSDVLKEVMTIIQNI